MINSNVLSHPRILNNRSSDTRCKKKRRRKNEERVEGNLFKIVGQFKNPKFNLKGMWDLLMKEKAEIGIEEIGEGAVCFVHCLEF